MSAKEGFDMFKRKEKRTVYCTSQHASQYALLNLSHVATSTSFTAEFPIHLEPENEPENELL